MAPILVGNFLSGKKTSFLNGIRQASSMQNRIDGLSIGTGVSLVVRAYYRSPPCAKPISKG
jgi:hypothetical protein